MKNQHIREIWQTDPEAAYTVAKDRIVELVSSNSDKLDLSGLQALEKLPDEIALCKNLRLLNLSTTNISDISIIENLHNLSVIKIGTTSLMDLSPLSKLTNLKSINASLFFTSNISFLEGLGSSKSQLRHLRLRTPFANDYSSLSSLVNLETLDLEGSSISNLGYIRKLTKLKKLVLGKTKIRDVSPISNFIELRDLDIANTSVADISHVSSLKKMSSINISKTLVSNISHLNGLHSLSHLDASNTSIKDVTALSGKNELRFLFLQGTLVSDLFPISGLNKLVILDFSNTLVSDFSFINGLNNNEIIKWLAKGAGLTFSRCRLIEDSVFQKISRKRNPIRTKEILKYAQYLEDKLNINQTNTKFDEANTHVFPDVPPQSIAPLEVEVRDGVLHTRRWPIPDLLNAQDNDLARQGWTSLRRITSALSTSLLQTNYPSLKPAVELYEEALTDNFAQCSPILLGDSGRWIENLADGADSFLSSETAAGLKALAAAHATFIGRFPAWRAYCEKSGQEPVEVRVLGQVRRETQAVVLAAAHMPECVDAEIPSTLQHLDASLEGLGANDPVLVNGALDSFNNLASAAAELVLHEAVINSEGYEFAQEVATESRKMKVKVAATWDTAIWTTRSAARLILVSLDSMSKLALLLPQRFGWMGRIVDWLKTLPRH